MVKTILGVMPNKSSPGDLRNFIDSYTVRIWINHSYSIYVFLLINTVIRMTITDLIAVVNNCRVLHLLVLGLLIVDLIRPKEFSEKLMKLSPIDFHSSHCILLLTQG